MWTKSKMDKIYGKKDFNLIENILKYGRDVPTYAPKKFDRTLESFENKYKY